MNSGRLRRPSHDVQVTFLDFFLFRYYIHIFLPCTVHSSRMKYHASVPCLHCPHALCSHSPIISSPIPLFRPTSTAQLPVPHSSSPFRSEASCSHMETLVQSSCSQNPTHLPPPFSFFFLLLTPTQPKPVTFQLDRGEARN